LTLRRGGETLHVMPSLRLTGRAMSADRTGRMPRGASLGRRIGPIASTAAASMNNLLAVSPLRLPGRASRAVAAVLGALVLGTPALAMDDVPAHDRLALAPAHLSVQGEDGAPSSPYARHLAALINAYRADRGLPPLELALELNALASEHSSHMATQGQLSHAGFRDRFDRTSARICVENVGVNFPHAEAQLDGWRASPGHHRNLLEPKVERMGIAKSASFVTFFACS
jgi:uncharacterized protein YkwD